MKKIIYIFGATTILAPSIYTMISYLTKTPVKNESLNTLIRSNKKIEMNKKINVKNDEVILLKQYYSGTIHDKFDGKNDGAAILGTQAGMNFSGSKGILTMGASDSLVFLYNDNNNDGLSIDNFRQTITFADTSIMSTMAPLLKTLGVKIGPFGTAYIPFKGNNNSGSLFRYFGSQNNHSTLTYNEAMARCKEIYSPDIYNKIAQYYTKASHKFVPIPIANNTITYKKIGINAMEVSFSNKTPITGAGIRIKPINHKAKIISPLSIGGPNEWKSYYKQYPNNILGDHRLNQIKDLIK